MLVAIQVTRCLVRLHVPNDHLTKHMRSSVIIYAAYEHVMNQENERRKRFVVLHFGPIFKGIMFTVISQNENMLQYACHDKDK